MSAAGVGGTPRTVKRQGRRMRALGDAFHRTIKWALQGVDEATFASAFPSLPYYYIPVLFKAYREVREREDNLSSLICRRLAVPAAAAELWIESSCSLHTTSQALHHARINIEAEFDACLEESRLPDRLQDLEVLCEEQGMLADGQGTAAAGSIVVSTSAPEAVFRALRHKAIKAENERLQAALEAEQAKLAELDARLAALGSEAEAAAEAVQRPVEVLARVHEASRQWCNRVEIAPAC